MAEEFVRSVFAMVQGCVAELSLLEQAIHLNGRAADTVKSGRYYLESEQKMNHLAVALAKSLREGLRLHFQCMMTWKAI